MVGLRYGSEDAARQTDRWLHAIARAAYLASVDLAKEKGAFPSFDADKYLASGAMEAMDAGQLAILQIAQLQNEIRRLPLLIVSLTTFGVSLHPGVVGGLPS